MPVTYNLIASSILSSPTATVTFNNIPSSFTDLVLRVSARNDVSVTRSNLVVSFNGANNTQTSTYIFNSGSSVQSARSNINNGAFWFDITGASATANTFGSVEAYIPSYNSTSNKPLSIFGVSETNGVTGPIVGVMANLLQTSSPITSMSFTSSGTFVAGSSFFLYGIKNT